MTLFSPDTLKDGYEEALVKAMRHLCLVDEVVTTVKAMRSSKPAIYMSLCILAHEYDKFAVYEAIKILDSLGQFPKEKRGYDESG